MEGKDQEIASATYPIAARLSTRSLGGLHRGEGERVPLSAPRRGERGAGAKGAKGGATHVLPGDGDAASVRVFGGHGCLQLVQTPRLLEFLHETLDRFLTPFVFSFALLETQQSLHHGRREGQHGHFQRDLYGRRRCLLSTTAQGESQSATENRECHRDLPRSPAARRRRRRRHRSSQLHKLSLGDMLGRATAPPDSTPPPLVPSLPCPPYLCPRPSSTFPSDYHSSASPPCPVAPVGVPGAAISIGDCFGVFFRLKHIQVRNTSCKPATDFLLLLYTALNTNHRDCKPIQA